MDIRSSMEGLRSLLGVSTAATNAPQNKNNAGAETSAGAFDSDKATVSRAASEVAEAAAMGDVRTEKVAAVQSALAAGSYRVPASAVASKLVDTMIGGAS